MVTELGGAQISSLLETLPGIAQVLRSPVADAFVTLIRQASRHPDFQAGAAEEVLRYSVRRNLMSQDESDRMLAEVREGLQRRADRAAERAADRKPSAAKTPPPKAAVKAAPAKVVPVKPAAKVVPAKAAVHHKPKPPVKAKPATKAKPASRPAAKAVRPPTKKKPTARKR